ncbi:MAG: hypothetical protein ACR2LF_07650 [Jatrophihabitantaceae bacterium]
MGDAHSPAGPFGEEAVRLLVAVQDWARRSFPEPAAAPGARPSDCQWCPICQLMAVVRGERPDVSERVAEAGTALASALRAVLDVATGAEAGPGAAAAGGPSRRPRPGRPRVQRIDLAEPADPSSQSAGTDERT